MNEIKKIEAVINALNNIEVKGRKNLDAMLGCIQTLIQVHDALLPDEEAGDEDG